MIHASRELVAAMRGMEPWSNPTAVMADREGAELKSACGSAALDHSNPWSVTWASGGYAESCDARDDQEAVTCPACLLLMHEATDPVRWDNLEERGLVSL